MCPGEVRRELAGDRSRASVRGVRATDPSAVRLHEAPRQRDLAEIVRLRVVPPLATVQHDVHPGLEKYTKASVELEKKLEALLDEYNFDGSDSMTNYFHVRFHANVRFDWEYEKAEKDTFEAALKADEAATNPDRAVPVLAPSTCRPLPPFPKTFDTYVPELDAENRPRSVNTLTGAVTYYETTKEVLEGLAGKAPANDTAPADPLTNYLATEGDL